MQNGGLLLSIPSDFLCKYVRCGVCAPILKSGEPGVGDGGMGRRRRRRSGGWIGGARLYTVGVAAAGHGSSRWRIYLICPKIYVFSGYRSVTAA